MIGRTRIKRGEGVLPAALGSGALSLLQLVNLSFLADTGKVGTIFVLAFATLGLGCFFFIRTQRIVISRSHVWATGAWLVIVLGSFQAFNQGWALLCAGVLGVYLLFFFLFANVSWSHHHVAQILVDALMVFGLLAALLGVYEYVHFQFCGPTQSPLIPYLLPPDREGRVSGPYGQPNLFALFLTLVLLAYFYRYLHGRGWGRPWGMRLRFLPVLVVASVFFLTHSRGGTLSLVLIVGFMLWMVASRRYLAGLRKERKEFFLLVACIVVGFLFSRLFSFTAGGEGASRLFMETGTGTSGRFIFWMSAILIFIDHPWLGVGLDNYRFLMNGYGPASHDVLGFVEFEAMKSSFWAHNELLQLLCEGGVFLFCLVSFFLYVFVSRMWRHFCRERQDFHPFFFYCHLFLLPFLIQALFSWPLRHPALLLLFTALAGVLVSQYPLRVVAVSGRVRLVMTAFFLIGLLVVGGLFSLELGVMNFKRTWLAHPVKGTLADFAALADHPYASYRVLTNAMPGYIDAALLDEDDRFARAIIPYAERLARLEGNAGQWYDLARLYWRIDRLEDARLAIANAFELKPTNTIIFDFLHHLNVLKASRATGRSVESFYPSWVERVDVDFSELKND